MQILQKLIHLLEESEWRRSKAYLAGALLLAGLVIVYNVREAKGFVVPEAMDQAQLARNLAEGKGYVTEFVRPLSLKLIGEKRHQEMLKEAEGTVPPEGEAPGTPSVSDGEDETAQPEILWYAGLDEAERDHPDLANAPGWPFFLSLAMRALPFEFSIGSESFSRYQPEVLIGMINQVLFFLSAFVLFLIAGQMFDRTVAWFATAVFLATDLLWQFCFSGLATHLVILLGLLLVWCLMRLERGLRASGEIRDGNEAKGGRGYYVGYSIICGLLLVGLTLTEYSLGALLVPVTLFLAFCLPGRRTISVGVVLTVFVLCVLPWMLRNYGWSGHFLGLAGYAWWQDTSLYPGNSLECVLKDQLVSLPPGILTEKLLVNAGEILQNEIPRMGGSWLSAFFLVGFLVAFKNRSLNRLRWFTLGSLLLLIVVQALGKKHGIDLDPQVNGENLLVVLLPLVYLFGAGLLYQLVDRWQLDFLGAYYYVGFLALLLTCLPMIFRLLPPRESPRTYPPYHPPIIERIGEWFEADDLLMSDMPWAVGWYADRRCLWLTRSLDPEFFEISDYHETIRGLYLTQLTSERRFISDILGGGPWGRLYADVFLNQEMPEGFPLNNVNEDFFPDQLFMTDWKRWSQ